MNNKTRANKIRVKILVEHLPCTICKWCEEYIIVQLDKIVREVRVEALSDKDPFIEAELKYEYDKGFAAAVEKAERKSE